jgi:hypothetical protein
MQFSVTMMEFLGYQFSRDFLMLSACNPLNIRKLGRRATFWSWRYRRFVDFSPGSLAEVVYFFVRRLDWIAWEPILCPKGLHVN